MLTKRVLPSSKANTHTYDPAGNSINVNHPDTTIDYFNWDARSLITLAPQAGIVVTMIYNALGPRPARKHQ